MIDLSRPDKAFATLQARAALAGATLQRVDDDRGREVFIVTRWEVTREFADLVALEEWLDTATREFLAAEVPL